MTRTLSIVLLSAALAAPALSQSPCFNTDLGTNLMLGDDDTAQGLSLGFSFTYDGVAYTQICVCSNGYIWLGGTSVPGGDPTPSEADLRSGAPRICPLWNDYNPAASGSGQVYYDTTTPGFARITWAGVFAAGSTIPNDIQVTLDSSNNVTISYGVVTAPAAGGSILMGASAGGGATTTATTFASRPFFVPSNSFAEDLLLAGNALAPYANTRMQWTSAGIGYAITDIACVPNQLPHPARAAAFGVGCPNGVPSFYEIFDTTNPADLSGSAVTFSPSGPQNYGVTEETPSNWFSGFTNQLPLGDNQTISVNLPFSFPWNGLQVNRVQVCSNGFLTLGTLNPGTSGNPTVTAMLAGPPRISGFWGDLNPPAAGPGGGVFADLDPVGGDFIVTWNQVPEWQNDPALTFQVALSPTGQFTIRWHTVQVTDNTFLTGYSRGNGSALTPARDISDLSISAVSNIVQTPMTLVPVAGSIPSLGTTFSQEAIGIPPFPNGVVTIHFTGLDTTTPAPLLEPGLPGCTAYMQIPELFCTTNLTVGMQTKLLSYDIPNERFLLGETFVSQTITDDASANAYGFRVSNGVRWTIGL